MELFNLILSFTCLSFQENLDSIETGVSKTSNTHPCCGTISSIVNTTAKSTNRNTIELKYELTDDEIDEPPSKKCKQIRQKNNEASRKSRLNKKAKEETIMAEAEVLEQKNRILKVKLKQLEMLVNTMRKFLLTSALSKRL